MTLGQSQWVGAAGDLVLSALDARLAGASQWAVSSANPLDVRPGIVYAGTPTLITGTAGLSVNVATFHFLSTKGTGNGPYLGTNKAVEAVTVPAAPSLGNKRIDLIWVRQEDKNASISADAATLAKFGVVTGTATSGTPAKPALPAGSTEVGTVTWDSSSTVAAATNAAQCTLATTCQWTVARGAAIPVRTTTERGATLTPYLGMRCLRLDKGGLEQVYDGTSWRGQRRHSAPYTAPSGRTTGFATITHGAGFTPATVNATGSTSGLQVRTDTYTSTTFRVQVINSDGSANDSDTWVFSADLAEALT